MDASDDEVQVFEPEVAFDLEPEVHVSEVTHDVRSVTRDVHSTVSETVAETVVVSSSQNTHSHDNGVVSFGCHGRLPHASCRRHWSSG